MICEHCHKENVDGVNFCFYCGSPMPKPNPKPNPNPNSNPDPNPNPNPEPMPTPTPTPAPMTKPAPQSKPPYSKGIFWVVISVIVLAVIIIACIMSLNMNKSGGNNSFVSHYETVSRYSPVQDDDSDAESDINYIPSAKEETDPVDEWEYENILDKTDELLSSELIKLQSALEDKSEKTGLTIKIIVDDDYSGSISSYAVKCCDEEISGSGIMMVLTDKYDNFGMATIGDGEDFTPAAMVDAMNDDVIGQLEYGNTYNACSKAIDRIPDSVSDAELYLYEQVSGAQQVVYADSSDGTLTVIDWSDNKPEKLFSTDTVYFGRDGVTSYPGEDKDATPLGTFRLGFAFSNVSLNTGLDYKKIEPNMVWVDDPNSDYYNMLVTITNYDTVPPAANPGKWNSSERTYEIFENGSRYACILIEHNGNGYTRGESGKGSCIYISGMNKNLSVSYGDVNISASDMRQLLACLDESKDPHIVIK